MHDHLDYVRQLSLTFFHIFMMYDMMMMESEVKWRPNWFLRPTEFATKKSWQRQHDVLLNSNLSQFHSIIPKWITLRSLRTFGTGVRQRTSCVCDVMQFTMDILCWPSRSILPIRVWSSSPPRVAAAVTLSTTLILFCVQFEVPKTHDIYWLRGEFRWRKKSYKISFFAFSKMLSKSSWEKRTG